MILKTPLILAICGTLALAACTDPSASGDSRAKQGAIAGALVGGFLGATRPGDNTLLTTAVGAAAGAAVGGAIGTALDRQANDLRRDLDNPNIRVVNTGRELVVTMPQDLLFAVDSSAVRPDLQSDLRAVAGNLRQYPDSRIEIIGHTDSTGPAGYNQELSERRARAVTAVLANAGVPQSRMVAIGRGEDFPVSTNLTPEGRAQNRRVEIIIRPIG